ncbi:heme-binding protein [Methanolobus mangrovi]|uniref:Heme-binding protein n=1 Tax=Methanolobus mangrovi TaxID=3072977 RepID=A0AA51UID6_9EURY|nr:heme-binding protein [Methanolobus mangrovi]WMW22256.1 heme-binding protein [Methanolobus mangrovi]
MTTKQIEYETLYELGNGVEVRQYGELTVVSAEANDSGAVFSALAAYISGNNKEKTKINMTSPVITFGEGSSVNMSFILPEDYDINNAPEPERDDIFIRVIPARKVAAITFSGYANDNAIEKNRVLLRSQVDTHGLVTKGDFFLMRYHPPWIPPSLMRNEVAIEVE